MTRLMRPRFHPHSVKDPLCHQSSPPSHGEQVHTPCVPPRPLCFSNGITSVEGALHATTRARESSDINTDQRASEMLLGLRGQDVFGWEGGNPSPQRPPWISDTSPRQIRGLRHRVVTTIRVLGPPSAGKVGIKDRSFQLH